MSALIGWSNVVAATLNLGFFVAFGDGVSLVIGLLCALLGATFLLDLYVGFAPTSDGDTP